MLSDCYLHSLDRSRNAEVSTNGELPRLLQMDVTFSRKQQHVVGNGITGGARSPAKLNFTVPGI
jgi:hypothetical protein